MAKKNEFGVLLCRHCGRFWSVGFYFNKETKSYFVVKRNNHSSTFDKYNFILSSVDRQFSYKIYCQKVYKLLF